MLRIRRFLDLDAAEREALFAFTHAHDPDRFPDLAAMAQGYASSAFEHGETQFSAWEGGRIVGAMGAVVRDAMARAEAFVTAVALEPGKDLAFAALLERALASIPPVDGLVARVGISPRHPHLEALMAANGFVPDYDGLIMARSATALAAPGDPAWAVETLVEANRAAYTRVMDEAFRHSPNGASVTEEQVAELMGEIAHADLLALARLDGVPVAAYELALQEDVGWIEAVAVAPGLQGKGIGRRMVACAIARLRAHGAGTIKLLVMSSNVPAVRLYERCGFRVEQVASRWWRRGTLTRP